MNHPDSYMRRISLGSLRIWLIHKIAGDSIAVAANLVIQSDHQRFWVKADYALVLNCTSLGSATTSDILKKHTEGLPYFDMGAEVLRNAPHVYLRLVKP